jgi:hypothetical protein
MKTFKEAFCEHYHSPPEAYLRRALRLTLYPQVAPLAGLLYWFGLAHAVQVLAQAGQTTDEDELKDVIDEYEYQLSMYGGILARRFNVRVSGRRLLDLHAQVRKAAS